MVPDISSALSEHDCTKLFGALQADLSWQWDSRFATALAEIRIEEKNGIGKILENHLGTAWTSGTIDTAPERVQRILFRLGGIIAGPVALHRRSAPGWHCFLRLVALGKRPYHFHSPRYKPGGIGPAGHACLPDAG